MSPHTHDLPALHANIGKYLKNFLLIDSNCYNTIMSDQNELILTFVECQNKQYLLGLKGKLILI